MATTNRAALIIKTHRTLKKHYKPVALQQRLTLEHILYASCLENARYQDADRAFPIVRDAFFDWNEVRVTSIKELAELLAPLPDPTTAAGNLKRVLQSVFESRYSFDLEDLQKENLGKAIKRLKAFDGVTPFVASYAVQSSLGGHSIPIDAAAMEVFEILGLAGPADVRAHNVPGLERAIPKSKGVEFGSLLHQLAADLRASRFSPSIHKMLLSINPEAKERLPKRPVKRKAAKKTATKPSASKTAASKTAKKKTAAKSRPAKKKAKAKKATKSSTRGLTKRRPR